MCTLGVALALSACGYRFGSSGRSFGPEIRTLRIGPLENRSGEVGLADALARALEAEFRLRGPLRVVGPDTTADLVLSGAVGIAKSRPVAFTSTDEALLYETALVVDLSLRRPQTEEVFWRVEGWRAVETFSAAADAVVTTSPVFQAGSLNPADLLQLTEIQLSESQRQETLDRLVEVTALQLYDQIMEDF